MPTGKAFFGISQGNNLSAVLSNFIRNVLLKHNLMSYPLLIWRHSFMFSMQMTYATTWNAQKSDKVWKTKNAKKATASINKTKMEEGDIWSTIKCPNEHEQLWEKKCSKYFLGESC